MSDANRTQGFAGDRARFATAKPAIWLLGLSAAAVVLLAMAGDSARTLLRYDRDAVLSGQEWWRLVTGHFVHGDLRHAGLNLLGLAVIAGLFPSHYTARGWLFVVALSVLAIDAGFVWNEPQLAWYVGMSGVLHGALAAGAIAWWRYESKGLASALSIVLVAKLAWEQTWGAMPFSGDMPVIVDAHLYGALGGLSAGLVLLIYERYWSRVARPL